MRRQSTPKFPKLHFFLCFFILLNSCSSKKSNREDRPDNGNTIAQLIDQYSDPDDPQRKEDIPGTTSAVLALTDPVKLTDVLNRGLSFAKEQVDDEPRYLCTMGRIALVLDHPDADTLLKIAGENGSGMAWVYLAEQYAGQADFQQAKEYLNKAKDNKFDEEVIKVLLEEFSAVETFRDFNRKDILTALYNSDMAALNAEKLQSSYYIGALHNTLWETEMLFFTEDPSIVLELDPSISTNLGFYVQKVHQFGLDDGAIIGSDVLKRLLGNEALQPYALIAKQATQDARRLAILYDSHPGLLHRVYQGAVQFAKQ